MANSSPFRPLCVLAGLLAAGVATAAFAQSTEPAIQERLVKKQLFLRQQFRENELLFGPAGELRSVSKAGPFTLAAVDIRKVDLRPDRLVLEGTRRGVELAGRTPVFMTIQSVSATTQGHVAGDVDSHQGSTSLSKSLQPTSNAILGNEKLHIEIMRPESGDYGPALKRIFAEGLAEEASALPPYWQRYAREHFISPPQHLPDDPTPTPGGSISPPVLLKLPRMTYTDAASALTYGGDIVLSFHVEADGRVTHLEVVKPIGLGLDEEALARMQGSTFKPAMQDGKPVVVRYQMKLPYQTD